MSLIKQGDAKNDPPPHSRTRIHLCPPLSQPDSTGFSGVEPEQGSPVEANLSNEVAAPPVAVLSVPGNAVPPVLSKSEQS